MQVSDIMTRELVSVAPDASIDTAIDRMLDHHISGLPVIDKAGRLVGILEQNARRARGQRLRLWRRRVCDPLTDRLGGSYQLMTVARPPFLDCYFH